MRKLTIIITSLLLHILLYGCSASTGTMPSVESLPIETISKELPFDFMLPPGYATQYKSNNEISIILNNKIIGGIIRTSLDSSCVTEAKSEERSDFLNSLVSPPVRLQYFLMLGNNCAYISVTLENVETSQIQEQSHRLFIKESTCFDIWLDNSLSNDTQKNQLFDYVISQ